MSFHPSRMRAVLSALIGSLAFVSGIAAAATPVRGGQIRIAIQSDLRGTNPGVDRDAITDDVLAHVVEGLVAYKKDLSTGLMLAKSMDVAADGLTYTFVLRDDVRFHNGAPLTSAEVKWSWERFLDPATRWRCAVWYNGEEASKIVSIDTPDRSTVVFKLDKPDGLFLTRMASFQCLAAILHPSSVGPDGKWIQPVATGPYRLREWKRGQYTLLERFDGYSPRKEPRDGYAGGKIAYADSLKWLVVPDSSASMSALRSSQVDLAYFFPPSELQKLPRESGIKVLRTPAMDWTSLLIQSTDPLLQDVRMRKAIAHALDAAKLAKTATYGLSPANPSVVPRVSSYYSPVHRQGYAYDPALAKQLLKEAGYRGQPIKLQTNRRNEQVYDSVIVAQSMLQQAGINLQVEVLDWAAMFSNWSQGKFQLMVFTYSARTDPALAYQLLIGDKSQRSSAQWQSARAEKLADEAVAQTDHAARQRIFEQLHELMLADVPFVTLFNGSAIDVTSARLSGYEVWSTSKPRLWGVWLKQ
jgi:peptide/nickel transport system substrate-binding protein